MDLKDFGKIECPKCSTKFRPLTLFKNKQIKDAVEKNRNKGLVNSNKKLVDQNEICAICAEPLELKWTVEHGKAYCNTCGAPYYLYKHSADGKIATDLHCGIKQSVRAGFRNIWIKHKDNLAKYSEGEKPQHSNHSKIDMNHNKVIEKEATINDIANPTQMNPMLTLRAVEALEGRDLENSDEKIEILEGKGWLVHQKNNKNSFDKYNFYSFDRLKKMVSILEAKKD